MNQKKVIALGFFDGVHRGHQALLEKCVAMAKELGCQTAAITFDRHPKALFLAQPPRLISTQFDRRMLLKQYGMDHVYTLPVTPEVMSIPWESFLQMLEEKGAVGFVCGDDFRFGCKGEGNSEKLKAYCQSHNLPCVIIPEQTVDGIRVSSSYIRTQIETGDMATAVKFLGHPYVLTGNVVRGQQLGRRLGIPTANLHLPEDLAVPDFGVYACRCRVDDVAYPAVTNVGVRPTVSGKGITVEPWILDYSGDLYDRQICLEFHYFLRPEQKFASLDALKAQIHADAEKTRNYLQQTLTE